MVRSSPTDFYTTDALAAIAAKCPQTVTMTEEEIDRVLTIINESFDTRRYEDFERFRRKGDIIVGVKDDEETTLIQLPLTIKYGGYDIKPKQVTYRPCLLAANEDEILTSLISVDVITLLVDIEEVHLGINEDNDASITLPLETELVFSLKERDTPRKKHYWWHVNVKKPA